MDGNHDSRFGYHPYHYNKKQGYGPFPSFGHKQEAQDAAQHKACGNGYSRQKHAFLPHQPSDLLLRRSDNPEPAVFLCFGNDGDIEKAVNYQRCGYDDEDTAKQDCQYFFYGKILSQAEISGTVKYLILCYPVSCSKCPDLILKDFHIVIFRILKTDIHIVSGIPVKNSLHIGF